MHASSDIRYLKMSKSCKTDTNSYGAAAFPRSSDRKQEKLNMVTKFSGPLIVSLFIEHVRDAETPGCEIIWWALPSVREAPWDFLVHKGGCSRRRWAED